MSFFTTPGKNFYNGEVDLPKRFLAGREKAPEQGYFMNAQIANPRRRRQITFIHFC
jgi:hypothetical protein